MKLSLLLSDVKEEYADIEISSLAFDTSCVKKGSLFFCLEGTKVDGHDFAEEAEKNGAAAIVAQRKTKSGLPHVLVSDTRHCLSAASCRFYGEPSKKLKTVAITGTNGKTTTTYIVKSILDAAGKKCGVIGTNAILIGERKKDAALTTPDPIELNEILREMCDENVEYVVMEASAHALALRKLDGIIFDVAAFTNLSRDHLDFFENTDNYFKAKKQLFTPLHSKYAVINSDDEKGREIAENCLIPFTTYGNEYPADVFSMDLSMSIDGLKYVLNLSDDIGEVKFNLPGKFNMYNTLCAAAIANALGIELKYILEGIRSLKQVDGRFNVINTSKCGIIIDFAHTDDGLRNILTTIREFAPKKIITVFGCGGDRDKTKRPVMGGVVSELSDFCFITSDNPRTEDPSLIIAEIYAGVSESKKNYAICETDRKTAIFEAIKFADAGDIVVIAGKGAEKYQDVMGIKQPYNDEKYVMELIEKGRI